MTFLDCGKSRKKKKKSYLWLRARFVTSDEEKCSVHNCSTVEHGGHKNIMSRTINKRHMSWKRSSRQRKIFFLSPLARLSLPQELHATTAVWNFAKRLVFFGAAISAVTSRSLTVFVGAFVDFGVGVTQLDGNVSFQFVLETNGLDTRNGLDDGGLTVSYVSNGT